MEGEELTRAERHLRLALWLHAGLSALFIVGYVVQAALGDRPFALLQNSVTKDVLLVALSALAAADLRRRGWLTYLVIGALLVLFATNGLMVALGTEPPGRLAAAAWGLADLGLAALFAWLLHRALRERHGLRWFDPVAWPTFVALADVLIQGEDEPVGPERIARTVDGYLAQLGFRTTLPIRGAFWLLSIVPPALMPRAARLASLKRRFLRDVSARRGLSAFAPLRTLNQAAVRAASQMTYLGFYGDPATYPRVGYRPYSARATPPPPSRTELRVLSGAPPAADVVVVGSGAAGAIAAHRLAEAGREVLVLERGPYVAPRDFTEDEVGMYLRLYAEGALTLARDFRLQVLQGRCVGGSTVVNNAICFDPPELVVEAWAGHGIDPAGLREGVAAVRSWLQVGPPPASVFPEAALKLGGLPVEMNATGCVGCGYCNVGCRYGRKLSMLDSVLPWGQAAFGDALRVLPGFEVARLEHAGGRVQAVIGSDGRRIRAQTVVLAAGAVASSLVLQRSGFGDTGAGDEVHFNVNSPLTALFEDEVDAWAGLQMSHVRAGPDGTLLESWFNPPATQALAMPGWFEDHDRNMRRYRRLACAGVLAGTTRGARVRTGRLGPRIDYTPDPGDLHRVVRGLRELGRIYLDEAGAQMVMPATYAYREFTDSASLAALEDQVRDNSDLLLTTAHPQGGNPVGAVLDEDFAVRGVAGLHVCDASAFPTSVGVNPQLTVMGLAHHAAGRIAR